MRSAENVRTIIHSTLTYNSPERTKHGREQEFFDKVLCGLRTQGCQSVQTMDGGSKCVDTVHMMGRNVPLGC